MSTIAKQISHRRGLETIEDRLIGSDNYIAVQREVTLYDDDERPVTDIDVLAVHKNGSLLLFEYKVNPKGGKEGKAVRQLDLAVDYIQQHAFMGKHEIYAFYVCGSPPLYKLERRIKW